MFHINTVPKLKIYHKTDYLFILWWILSSAGINHSFYQICNFFPQFNINVSVVCYHQSIFHPFYKSFIQTIWNLLQVQLQKLFKNLNCLEFLPSPCQLKPMKNRMKQVGWSNLLCVCWNNFDETWITIFESDFNEILTYSFTEFLTIK